MAGQRRGIGRALKSLFDAGDWISMKPQLDPQASLISFDYKAETSEIVARAVVAGIMCVIVAIVYFGFGSEAGVIAALTFGMLGFANLILGLAKIGYAKSILFTGHDVKVTTRGLLGRREWREPLASYHGVMLSEHHSRSQGVGNTVSTKTYHVIELVHDNDGRTVPLYVRRGMESPRDIQEAFARRFDLPALAPDSDGETARAADALDAPVSAQPVADPGPPPSGVKVGSRNGAVTITVGQGRTGRAFVWIYWLAIPIAFTGIGYMIEPSAALPAGGMVVFFVLMMFGIGKLMGGEPKRPSLVIERDRVWIDRPKHDDRITRLMRRIASAFFGQDLPQGERPPETLPRNSIEQIRVDTYTSHYSGSSSSSGHGGSTIHDRLVIEGDDGRLSLIGTQFDKKKLEWVRDYLRHKLAGGSPVA